MTHPHPPADGWHENELAELDPVAVQELAPSETLHVGVVQAPAAGIVFAALDAAGVPRGVPVSLGSALARHVARPVAFTVLANSGELTDALAAGQVDVGFMPVDDQRRARVVFGPGYFLLQSTFLVSAASGITDLAGVDREGMRVVGIADTTTIRAATRTLRHTVPVPVRGVEGAIALLRDGGADALALSRDSLNQVAPTIPGSRITPGGFQQTTVSVAVPPGRPAALALVSEWLQAAKQDGTVRDALDAVGLPNEPVAP